MVYIVYRPWSADLDRKAPGCMRIVSIWDTLDNARKAAKDTLNNVYNGDVEYLNICKVPMTKTIDEVNWEKYIVDKVVWGK